VSLFSKPGEVGAACNEDDIFGDLPFYYVFFGLLFIYLFSFSKGIGRHHGAGNSTQKKKKELRRFAYVYAGARVCVTAFI